MATKAKVTRDDVQKKFSEYQEAFTEWSSGIVSEIEANLGALAMNGDGVGLPSRLKIGDSNKFYERPTKKTMRKAAQKSETPAPDGQKFCVTCGENRESDARWHKGQFKGKKVDVHDKTKAKILK